MAYKLRINKLITIGSEYKRTFSFDEKLNIIKGDGYSGKSLVLSLINYCLGSKKDVIDLTVQKQLNEYCDECYLEISINNKPFTFYRHLKKNTSDISIYLCEYDQHDDYSPWKKSPDESCDFIASEIGIELHVISKRKAHSSELTTEKLSFRDLMRFVYFEQGTLGTESFMGFKEYASLRKKNQEVFKIINDLILPDLLEIEERLRFLNNDLSDAQKKHDALHNYLQNRDALNVLTLEKSKEELKNKIGIEQKKKESIIKNMTSEGNDFSTKLKEDYNTMEEIIRIKNNEKNLMIMSIVNKQSLLSDYNSDLLKLKSTIEVMKTIKISDHDYQCPLCSSLVKCPTTEEAPIQDVEKSYNDTIKKSKELNKVIEIENSKLESLEKEIENQIEKQKIILKALNEYNQHIEAGVIAEVEALNSIIKDFYNELNKISSLYDMNNDLDKYSGSIDRLKNEIKKVESQKDNLKELKDKEDMLLEMISDDYREVLKGFNFDNDDQTYINKNDFMPYYSGQNFIKHSSGCLRLCMQIAYIVALLQNNKKDLEKYKHPCILMLDTISNNLGTNKDDKDSLDPQTYVELYNRMIELSEWNQVFIIDNTPPSVDAPHKSFEFHRIGLRGFIDMSQNEMKTND